MESKSVRPNLGAVSKVSLPFYEPPPRKTSAQIINEARAAIQDAHLTKSPFASTSIKPIQTQRPFTPRNKERILFGKKSKSSRPPSSFSLRYLQNEADLGISIEANASTPTKRGDSIKNNIIKTQRSNSVSSLGEEKIFDLGINNPSLHKIKLPSLELLKPLQKKKLYKNTYSLDNRKSPNHDIQLTKKGESRILLVPEEHEDTSEFFGQGLGERNAFSSPQERTDFSENPSVADSPFGRPSQKQNNLSKCLLLGPQNLNKLFDNKQIVENSETLFTKTGYFRKSKEFQTLDNDKSAPDENLNKPQENTVENILALLNQESKRSNNEVIVINLINNLYSSMERENCWNANIDSKIKIKILKCLYKFVESQNEHLLLNIARIILALKVTGNNLSGVCKLIFKVSKCDKNDNLFLEKNTLDLFVDALGRCSPLDDGEACVYGYGSVKFLTMNSRLLKRILELGVLQLMVLHIKIINNAKLEKLQIPEQTDHALFQLTGALRNLASEEDIYNEFIATEAVYQLCQTMDLFSSNLDIVSNISRTLSTISTNDNCCDKIAEYDGIYKIFIRLFEKYPGNEGIIVRLAYTLGNILAKLDNARCKFYEEKNSISSLICLWKIYLERTLKNCSLKIDNAEEASNTEDVMIKIIRIIANIAINTEIGKSMNEEYGIQLIDEFLKVLISNPFKKNDELILSILSTLNNLSYYYSAELDHDIFHIKQVDLMEAIAEYLDSKNTECVIEAIRILGNLSRSKITRKHVVESDIFVRLINILDKDDINLLRTTVGVFVNLMADSKNRVLFKNNNGLSKLIIILNVHGQYDWPLSMLICQVIWNFCIDSLNLYELISDSEIQQLLIILADYLDEERLFGITDASEDLEVYSTQEYMVWEEFANVATNLLEKIENFLDTLEQSESSSTDNIDVHKTRDCSTNLSFAAW